MCLFEYILNLANEEKTKKVKKWENERVKINKLTKYETCNVKCNKCNVNISEKDWFDNNIMLYLII